MYFIYFSKMFFFSNCFFKCGYPRLKFGWSAPVPLKIITTCTRDLKFSNCSTRTSLRGGWNGAGPRAMIKISSPIHRSIRPTADRIIFLIQKSDPHNLKIKNFIYTSASPKPKENPLDPHIVFIILKIIVY